MTKKVYVVRDGKLVEKPKEGIEFKGLDMGAANTSFEMQFLRSFLEDDILVTVVSEWDISRLPVWKWVRLQVAARRAQVQKYPERLHMFMCPRNKEHIVRNFGNKWTASKFKRMEKHHIRQMIVCGAMGRGQGDRRGS